MILELSRKHDTDTFLAPQHLCIYTMYQVIMGFIGAMRGDAWLMSAGRVHVTRVMSISLEEIDITPQSALNQMIAKNYRMLGCYK